MKLEQLLKEADGHRFQKEFAEFCSTVKNDVIVETGHGTSTVFLLALNPHSKIYSIDPAPWCGYKLEDERGELIKKQSYDAMLELYERTGQWDIFLHDSNHDIKCMTYELNFGYACLRQGGYLACDDCGWGGHTAWEDFVANYNLSPSRVGSLQVIRKTTLNVLDMKLRDQICKDYATQKEKEWLASGKTNTPIKW